ncbi:hypothetical protein C0991_000650, partial [Blastosporella zonata]
RANSAVSSTLLEDGDDNIKINDGQCVVQSRGQEGSDGNEDASLEVNKNQHEEIDKQTHDEDGDQDVAHINGSEDLAVEGEDEVYGLSNDEFNGDDSGSQDVVDVRDNGFEDLNVNVSLAVDESGCDKIQVRTKE